MACPQGRRTRVCQYCSQELSHAAYYRHVQDKFGRICPGRIESENVCTINTDAVPQGGPTMSDHQLESELDDDVLLAVEDNELDTSFEFEGMQSSEEGEYLEEEPFVNEPEAQAWSSNPVNDREDSSDESSLNLSVDNSMTDSDDFNDVEIWDNSDSDDEKDDVKNVSSIAQHVIRGITLFLTALQLFFKLPERAMSSLLFFIRMLLTYLTNTIQHPLLNEICRILPKTMWTSRKLVGMPHSNVIDYVVCPKCNTIYKLTECMDSKEYLVDRSCEYVEFPNHPIPSRRIKCNTSLMKKVKVAGSFKVVPRKVYQYHSVIDSLKQLIGRRDFLKKCELWRKRTQNVKDGEYADIYDGDVWKSLCGSGNYLASPYNFCFTMNVDWFNPYKDTEYSAGAIYLAIQNLPRTDRYLMENVLLIGMIPGPKEPEKDINTFLQPLIDDLKILHKGVTIRNANSFFGSTTIRGMLICIGSDLPATRKICGFLSYNATKGCSKCLKEFPTAKFGEKPNYSGFDCDHWEPRQTTLHKVFAEKVQDATTPTAKECLEKQYGLRYSILLALPYFDIVRYHTIDPMHNIFLGIAKKTVKLWKKRKLLKDSDFKVIQGKVDSMNPPPSIGRIPRKISSGFSSFTADEWKHWILIYSLYALNSTLPIEHYNCWYLFVEACKKLCQTVITKSQVLDAHELLLEFCRRFQHLYGAEACTPNMHMACHLKDCICDYGPLPAFWCFSFERFNGVLESMCKSWQGPEKQMFSKFLDLQFLKTLTSGNLVGDEHGLVQNICSIPMFKPSIVHSSVEQTSSESDIVSVQRSNYTCDISQIDATEKKYQTILSPLTEKVFDDSEMRHLEEMYAHLYPASLYECVQPARFYEEGKQAIINKEHFISTKARSMRSAAVIAHWATSTGISHGGDCQIRPGLVLSFIRHKTTVRKLNCAADKTYSHVLARVHWFQNHSRRDTYIPTLIVTSTLFDPESSATFIPISRIAGRCAYSKATVSFDYGEDTVNLCVPLHTAVLV